MFLVGGGILAHAIPGLEAALLGLEGTLGVILGTIASMLANALVGIIAGGVIVGALTLARKARGASH
jgi:predicted DNA repair protein MutK